MEPIIVLTYIVTSFFGYYIGTDMGNYIRHRSDYNEINTRLDRIDVSINRLNKN